jgi:hypothetical protein
MGAIETREGIPSLGGGYRLGPHTAIAPANSEAYQDTTASPDRLQREPRRVDAIDK